MILLISPQFETIRKEFKMSAEEFGELKQFYTVGGPRGENEVRSAATFGVEIF